MLCEAGADCALWQCLAEGAALEIAGWTPGVLTLGDTSWEQALRVLRRQRSQYMEAYPFSKAAEFIPHGERDDALDGAGQQLTDEINLYLSRLFGGKPMMADAIESPSYKPLPNSQPLPFDPGDESNMPTATRKPAKAKTPETDDELLARSLQFHAEFEQLQERGATDDELLMQINQRWRMAPVSGPRPYKTVTNTQSWGTAIWFDDFTPDTETIPSLYAAIGAQGKIVGSLLPAVRRVLGIGPNLCAIHEELGIPKKRETNGPKSETNGHAGETDAGKFEAIKAKGKGRAKAVPPATTGTSTPAGIRANDPDAVPAAQELVIAAEIVKRPLDWFVKSPFDTRQSRPKEWIEELAASLMRDGQLQPCLARPDGQHIAGWTRVEAARLAGLTELDVRIVTCDDSTARRLVLLENAKRRDLTEREKTEAYNALADDYGARGLTQKQLAQDLGIGESTLSNNLRLRSLPPTIWERHEAGGLSIDQLRALAVHAARPKFVEGFVEHLTKRSFCKLNEQPENHHFESAVELGIARAYRPMTGDSWGGGCQFKPTDDQKRELGIVELPARHGGHVRKMATNVALWNKLNKEAKAKQKAKEAAKAEKAPDPKKLKAAAKVEAQARQARRQEEIEDCWHIARGRAIAARFAKPRKQDHAAAVRLRLWIAQEESYQWQLDFDVLISDEAEFVKTVCDDVHKYFNNQRGVDCALEVLEDLVSWLQVDPAPHWKPSSALLEACPADELQELADEFDLPEGTTANDLVAVLLSKWPAGHVPAQFCLEKPKATKKSKK